MTEGITLKNIANITTQSMTQNIHTHTHTEFVAGRTKYGPITMEEPELGYQIG
jgi:hypothetical protein